MKTLLFALFVPAVAMLAEPPVPQKLAVQAKILKFLVKNSSVPGKVLCNDPSLGRELEHQGLKLDPNAKIAWATTQAEVEALSTEGKLIVCDSLGFLAEGASVGIVEEKGHLAVYFHMAHTHVAKVRLNPVVYEMMGSILP
jgi:hypothetical protein